MSWRRIVYLLILYSNLTGIAVVKAASKNSSKGFIDFNIYPYLSDVDNDNVLTMKTSATLNSGFSYYGFVNIGNQSDANELEDTIKYYTEQNLRWKINDSSPIDITFQANLRTGEDNDRYRLGVRWRLNDTAFLKSTMNSLKLNYALNLHPVQFDKDNKNVWALGHVFHLKLTERLYLGGFIDQVFNETLPVNFPANPIVGEAQLGFELMDNFYLVGEYRVNQYRRQDVNNFALGFEYIIKW